MAVMYAIVENGDGAMQNACGQKAVSFGGEKQRHYAYIGSVLLKTLITADECKLR